jgi:hypothetical protein
MLRPDLHAAGARQAAVVPGRALTSRLAGADNREKVATFPARSNYQAAAFLESGMDDEFALKVAVDRAWTVHLATHKDIDANDPRRCSLERYLGERWLAGESDPDELTCYGLSYLVRLRAESW